MSDMVKITTTTNGNIELAFTRADDTGADKTTTVYFTPASWVQFSRMMQAVWNGESDPTP